MSMIGKRALVTGAGTGIGRATAVALAAAGAKVALLGRTVSELAQVFDEIGGDASGHLMLIADVSSGQEMKSAYSRLTTCWDSLDTVIASAGIQGVWAPLDLLEPDEWDETLGVNLRGTFLTVKFALPHLRKNGGSVVIVSSINGNRVFSNSGASAYACSQAGQLTFAKMAALELAADRIRVNVVCPGGIEARIEPSTERRDVARLHPPLEFPEGDVPFTEDFPGTAQEVARAIYFLASDDAAHITGTEVYVTARGPSSKVNPTRHENHRVTT